MPLNGLNEAWLRSVRFWQLLLFRCFVSPALTRQRGTINGCKKCLKRCFFFLSWRTTSFSLDDCLYVSFVSLFICVCDKREQKLGSCSFSIFCHSFSFFLISTDTKKSVTKLIKYNLLHFFSGKELILFVHQPVTASSWPDSGTH